MERPNRSRPLGRGILDERSLERRAQRIGELAWNYFDVAGPGASGRETVLGDLANAERKDSWWHLYLSSKRRVRKCVWPI